MTQPVAKQLTNSNGTPAVEWTWLYYIPFDTKIPNTSSITVKFDIELKNGGRSLFDYLDYIDSGWKGKVFQYSTKHTLMEDLDHNLTY